LGLRQQRQTKIPLLVFRLIYIDFQISHSAINSFCLIIIQEFAYQSQLIFLAIGPLTVSNFLSIKHKKRRVVKVLVLFAEKMLSLDDIGNLYIHKG